MANTVRCFHSRSLGLDILARRRHHGNCSAFGSLELGPNHRPLQAALSGSLIKAPGFAGGYLLQVGSAETLLDDSVRLAAVAGDAGMRVTLDIWPDMIHAFTLFYQQVAMARLALDQVAAFLRAMTGRSS